MLPTLVVEVFQAERSALEHPRKEADRLGDAPPGLAMRAVSLHAKRCLRELQDLSLRVDLPGGFFGQKLGRAFSIVRSSATDRLVTREISYRGTLLGMHHGVDVIALTMSAAEYESDVDLVEWCMRTLDGRRPLVAKCQSELAWFGRHPEVAMEPAKRGIVARAARLLTGMVTPSRSG